MPPRAQCIVYRGNKLLMVKHRHRGVEWWCLPGGGVEEGETPTEATIRELREECNVEGTIVRETSVVTHFEAGVQAYTYLVDIGDQEPGMGHDPEFEEDEQVLADVRWVALDEVSERDRAFLWSAGLLGIQPFYDEVANWGDWVSYPGRDGEETQL
jgi:ADP-ribose pyrophosphatase YjhB (NUDIX family)